MPLTDQSPLAQPGWYLRIEYISKNGQCTRTAAVPVVGWTIAIDPGGEEVHEAQAGCLMDHLGDVEPGSVKLGCLYHPEFAPEVVEHGVPAL